MRRLQTWWRLGVALSGGFGRPHRHRRHLGGRPGYDPTNREARRPEEPAIHSGVGHDPEVVRLRHSLKPLNAETGFIDTAAAFAALPPQEQRALEKLQVWYDPIRAYSSRA